MVEAPLVKVLAAAAMIVATSAKARFAAAKVMVLATNVVATTAVLI